MSDHIRKVLDAARGEIGVREIGSSNTGKKVQEYQAATTLSGTGWPWCAAFVSWCIEQGLGKELARDVWLNSASCDMILYWARRRGIVTSNPAIGSCGLVMASANDATHIFLVEAVKAGVVTTIEGNTNGGGSREGNGVYRRSRPQSSRYQYVHWPHLLPTTIERPWELWGQTKIGDVLMRDGRAIVPAWKWAHWFGMELGWNQEAQTVTLNGCEVPAQPMMIDGRAWLGIRELAAFTDFTLKVEPGKITVLR